jgi:aminoglycoside 3-N-acetyltransferase I
MEVRRLHRSDAHLAVNAIRLLKTPEGYPVPSAEYLAEFLSQPYNVLIVATDQGVPVGYTVAYLLDRVDRDRQMMFFYEIGVAEPHRRRGIGTAMVVTLKEICRHCDAMKMWVPTGRSNIAATRLYTRTGAVAVPGTDEVTYAYARESYIDPTEQGA